MKSKQALVPKLRFGDGSSNPYTDWHEKKLGDVGIIKSGVGFPEKEQGGKQGIPFYKVSDMNLNGNSHTMTTANNYVTDDQIADKKYKPIREKSIIFAKVGAAVFLERKRIAENFLLDNNMMAFTPTFDINFGKYLFSQIRLSKYAQVGALPSYNGSDIATIKVSIPSLPEQEKIAAFLTSVDDRIDQLKRKKSLLQDYKKGAMQKLFSQELRFKDEQGKDFPDWEVKELGDVYSYQSTNSYSRDKLNYEAGKVYNIHYGDIHTKFRCHFSLSKEYVPFLNKDIEINKIKSECFLQTGDIILADASEDYADIGKSIEVMDLDGTKVVAGLHTYILRPDASRIAKGFGAYLMQARPTRLEVMRIAQGTKVLGLPKAYLSFITLNIPHPEEQTKIANFLSSLDRKIEQVDTQITQTQTFKKGLLQQMFV